ncbi:putative zinc finger (C3HC4 RING finger) protein [Neospora caninum Liverpool]|uniref:Putative zinc finger (C3HC4 RING finger) protein n=1 Tax=Neospora caninum (strain Liverpool) TaxID=572307 RepID=F0VQ94_NEOCL|nr:putative zinc finger (C3HC4 RING finger) protein [Neospora caninum Liverpool]CBZ55891.1 putative zinc finger (C3HC4 RING finger) protein [Neospora caninum Liverpool]CEL70634.1 TPA: zinc finger (C3HC4 RING finger) protein,putative [Neospora caninum Liverpool]|eukprot:XP_003885917.1 putative zinc finger (C3HC4 RING finger) protein [Neospora caninum Liverpool]
MESTTSVPHNCEFLPHSCKCSQQEPSLSAPGDVEGEECSPSLGSASPSSVSSPVASRAACAFCLSSACAAEPCQLDRARQRQGTVEDLALFRVFEDEDQDGEGLCDSTVSAVALEGCPECTDAAEDDEAARRNESLEMDAASNGETESPAATSGTARRVRRARGTSSWIAFRSSASLVWPPEIRTQLSSSSLASLHHEGDSGTSSSSVFDLPPPPDFHLSALLGSPCHSFVASCRSTFSASSTAGAELSAELPDALPQSPALLCSAPSLEGLLAPPAAPLPARRRQDEGRLGARHPREETRSPETGFSRFLRPRLPSWGVRTPGLGWVFWRRPEPAGVEEHAGPSEGRREDSSARGRPSPPDGEAPRAAARREEDRAPRAQEERAWREGRSLRHLSSGAERTDVGEDERSGSRLDMCRVNLARIGWKLHACGPNGTSLLFFILFLSMVCFPLVVAARVLFPPPLVPDYVLAIIPFFCFHCDASLTDPGLSRLRLPLMALHLVPLLALLGSALGATWVCHLACVPFFIVLLSRWPRAACLVCVVVQVHLELVLISCDICRIPGQGSQGWVLGVVVALVVTIVPWMFFLTVNSQLPQCTSASPLPCVIPSASALLLFCICLLWCLTNALLVSNLFSLFLNHAAEAAPTVRAKEASLLRRAVAASQIRRDRVTVSEATSSVFLGVSKNAWIRAVACFTASALGSSVFVFLYVFRDTLLPRPARRMRESRSMSVTSGLYGGRLHSISEGFEREESLETVDHAPGSRAESLSAGHRPGYSRGGSADSRGGSALYGRSVELVRTGSQREAEGRSWESVERRASDVEIEDWRQRAVRAAEIQRRLKTHRLPQTVDPRVSPKKNACNRALPVPSSKEKLASRAVHPFAHDAASVPARPTPDPSVSKASPASPMCTICQDALQGGSWVSEVPRCSHTFHAACLQSWLLHRGTCPNCNADLGEALLGESVEVVA